MAHLAPGGRRMGKRELVDKHKHDTDDDASVRADTGDTEQSLPDRLLAMQRTGGNPAVNAYVQTKPEVGPADDPLEREADEIATSVVGHQGESQGGHGGYGGDAG